MKEFSTTLGTNYPKAIPILGNTNNTPQIFATKLGILRDKKANLVVTSPPYGDHGTTVAYGQFSKHPGMWLELEDNDELLAVDSNGLGGQKKEPIKDLRSGALDKILEKIKKKDSLVSKNKTHANRTADVYSFFYDLDNCFDKISQVLKPNQSHCCFVVANRTVRREKIPTDIICVELAKKYGFKHVDTIYREIKNKVFAKKNAPENIVNNSGETMNEESIIIWEY
jgi:tRNA G10  N-methylase Trm11